MSLFYFLFSLERLVMGKIIKSVHRIGTMLILIAICVCFYQGIYDKTLIFLGGFATVIVWRILCELAILFFSINDHLGSIRHCSYRQLDVMKDQL